MTQKKPLPLSPPPNPRRHIRIGREEMLQPCTIAFYSEIFLVHILSVIAKSTDRNIKHWRIHKFIINKSVVWPAMGTKMGTSFGNLFVGYAVAGIDDCFYQRETQSIYNCCQFVSSFLDIKVSIEGNGLCTSVHYKPTDSHSLFVVFIFTSIM